MQHTRVHFESIARPIMKTIFRNFAPAAALSVALLSFALNASAEVDVQTLGGGRLTAGGHDYGNADGNTYTQAQYNTPWATALDSSGNMFMADRLNNSIRKISFIGNLQNSQTATYLSNLSAPIGVVVDSADNLYVLTSDNVIRKYNLYKNLVSSNYLGNVSGPSAMTLAPNGSSLYVCYTSGSIYEVYQNGTTRLVLSNCGTMRGIGVLPSGEIVVSLGNSTSFTNAIIVCSTNSPNPANPVIRLLAGNNGTGFVDGAASFVKFNGPHGLAVTVDGKVVVADRYNNRVRVIDGSGTTTTLYGVDQTNWNLGYFPGWADGNQTDAAAREPVSVCISTNGFVFTTEVYYHILREVTGSGLTTGTTGGGTNVVTVTVPPPSFAPNCGYYPQCQTITVTTGGGNVYYTTDGSEPTTNSLYVATPNNVGTFTWCNATNSLVNLKMKAFLGTNFSATVTGVSCGDNEIGITRDVVAGVGSTVVVPVVVTLQSNGVLKSLQFRVEVTPANGAPDMISDLQVIPITSNDFVRVIAPGANVTYSMFPYTTGSNGRGLVVSAAGASSGFTVNNQAVVALLKIAVPKTCTVGQTYQMNILFPSGTSDGVQAEVPLTILPARNLTIQTVQYLAGDSASGRWYNAGEFGDSILSSSDVNNALYAAAGIRKPYEFTDAFQAMDTWPETPSQIGNGFITFLDWQTILFRSVGIDTNNWLRYWGANGLQAHTSTSQVVTPHSLTPKTIATPGNIWLRQAAIGSGVAVNQLPGNVCSMPVYAKVAPGYNLAGLQFRATLVPEGAAPTPGTITFTPAAGMAGGQILPGLSANDIVCAWSLGAFASPLQNSNYIGQISFTVPSGAQPGQRYKLQFSYVDGAPDLNTFYQLESFPGSVWVMSTAATSPSSTSDEWKTAFFGSVTNGLAADNADADGDGVPNWKEFLAGTNPTNAASCLQFTSAVSGSGSTTLTWLSAPAKNYAIEAASSINATTWTTLGSVTGDGTVKQVTEPNTGAAQFYRIRLQP
ncbi:MAG: hypothetical protein JWO95_35 [Verrucomicrobiales bacterium]|nr:hypothetical protein [Verrucomicrobiales bacterium]